jgi:hypothetical protein
VRNPFYIRSGSTTSKEVPPSPSSSSLSPEAQAVAEAAQNPSPLQSPPGSAANPSEGLATWIPIVLAIVGIIVAGVASYYGALMSVRDMISKNSADISLNQQKLEVMNETLKQLEADSQKVQKLETDLALICLRLQISNICSRR